LSGPVALWTVLSPALIVLGAAVLIGLERRFPYCPGQKLLRPGLWVDLVGYTLVQSTVLGWVITRLIALVDAATGWSRWRLVGGWSVPLQVVFFVVTHDLYIYGFHRLQHRVRWLWRIHEAHHATRQVDWLSGVRSHALEILINQTIELAPIVLLGAAPEVALIKVTIDAVWGMYIHANIDVRSGRLQWVLNGPEMHRWHHAIEIQDGVNFATKLAWWDRLFASAYLPSEKPSGYGIVEPFPEGYLAQQLHLFRARPIAPPAPTGAAPSPSSSPSPSVAEEPLGVDGRHATRARRRHRLAVDMIRHVAAGEDPGNPGGGRAGPGHEVPRLIHVQLPNEDL
jgi:sterol desaturase/sphingolipid hydroxylase (fatty acid hydroxylase superfamily)